MALTTAMVKIPANWQRLALERIIEASALPTDKFRYEGIREGYARQDTGFAYLFEGLADGAFVVDWQDWKPDVTGYGGRRPAGNWHVTFRPGREDPIEERNGLRWEDVETRFSQWVDYLEREVLATEVLRRGVVSLPMLLPPDDQTPDAPLADEIEIIEPLLAQVEEDFIEVIEEEYATADDLEELRAWFKAEIADVRSELKRQSKRGFRRTVVGMVGNVVMRFGGDVWPHVQPAIDEILRVLDGLPRLGQ